ncbi:MAG: hypothetical protein NTW28_29875 [Candidatus Solibacter sp.]|nr:hypothetical protein [Candidatus Solibacter sp.]
MPRIADMTGAGYVEPGGRRRTPRHYQEAMASRTTPPAYGAPVVTDVPWQPVR